MALVKYGGIISEARGKEAGIIFSRNSYGGYIKQKVSPVNPQTAYQQTVRAQLGTTAQQWSGLTQEQQDDWKDLGQQVLRVNRFGDQTFYTGFNLFVKTNRNRLLMGLAAITSPAAVPAIPTLSLTSLTMQEDSGDLGLASLVFTTTGGDAAANFQLVVDATMPIYTGRKFVKNFYRQLGHYPAETSPANVLANYIARFGLPITLGAFVAVRARLIDEASGLDGPIAVVTTNVVSV